MTPLQQVTTTTADAIGLFMSSVYDSFAVKPRDTEIIDFDDSRTLAVMCVSLSFAAVSVMAALFAFYWFIRMRRGFRQDMIMLLIQSDMAKAVWLIVSPLFYFSTQRPFSSNFAFCQVSGFFLAVTIEASDIAVLLIAIHTVLFIVKRQHPDAAVGLEPYRRIAYTLWAIVPILLAAIVPITGSHFVDNGRHCYLPVEPLWYRTALSWAPRYIICFFIIVTYTWLYIYVHLSYRRFGQDHRRANGLDSPSSSSSHGRRRRIFKLRGVPPTPTIVTHGLLDSARPSITNIDALKARQDSSTSTVSTLRLGEVVNVPITLPPPQSIRKSSIAWNLIDFGRNGTGSLGTSVTATPEFDAVAISPTTQYIPPYTRTNDINMIHNTSALLRVPEPIHQPHSGASPYTCNSQGSIESCIWRRRHAVVYPDDSHTGSQNSLATIISVLRLGPPPIEGTQGGTGGADEEVASYPSSSVRLPTDVSEATMRRSRDKMLRQLRLLFVYPAIYILTWIAPFVEHMYPYQQDKTPHYPGGNSNSTTTVDVLAAFSSSSMFNSSSHTVSDMARATYVAHPTDPFVLRIIGMASLCIGAAVDCGFFSAWEKPWLHLQCGFWEGLAKRFRVHRICGYMSHEEKGSGPGRTRDERVTDARHARLRRDRESETILAQRLMSTLGVTDAEGRRGQGRGREWWDVLDDTCP